MGTPADWTLGSLALLALFGTSFLWLRTRASILRDRSGRSARGRRLAYLARLAPSWLKRHRLGGLVGLVVLLLTFASSAQLALVELPPSGGSPEVPRGDLAGLALVAFLWLVLAAAFLLVPLVRAPLEPGLREQVEEDLRSRFGPSASIVELTLPRRVYAGDSHAVTLALTLGPHEGPREGRLDVALASPAVRIGSEAKQSQPTDEERLQFHWNCHFGVSGAHDVTLTVAGAGAPRRVHVHRVKVVSLLGLTRRQVDVLKLAGAVLTVLLTGLQTWAALVD